MTIPQQNLVVTLSGAHPASEVADHLKQHGFQVNNVLESIGVITGTGNVNELASWKAHPGISDISEDHTIDIGPPEATTTW